MKETFCAAIQIPAEQSVEMADRNPRKRRPPTRFNDFEAVELINDSEADLTDIDLDDDSSFSDSSSSSNSDLDSDRDDDPHDQTLPPPPSPQPVDPPSALLTDAVTSLPADYIQRPLTYWNEIPYLYGLQHGPLLVDQSLPYQWEDFRETKNDFAFATKDDKTVGFQVDDIFPPDVSIPDELSCFEAVFTPEIRNHLMSDINSYGELRVQKNSPARKRSRFGVWKPTTESEMYKYLAVVTAMGIDKRPHIRDYWATQDAFLDTPWYNRMFPRERFEVCLPVDIFLIIHFFSAK